MPHPSANSSWFVFNTPTHSDLRAYAFSVTEEIHKPYEFEIKLVHESGSMRALDDAVINECPVTQESEDA
jgi:type VI secretion system secreted protein VgrG